MYIYREFNDSEAELVKTLKKVFQEIGVNARVATKRLPEDKRSSDIDEVVVQCFNEDVSDNNIVVDSDFTIYVYCYDDNENVATKRCNDLKRKVLSSLRIVTIRSSFFKSVYDVSSSKFEDEGQTQIRSILASFTSYTNNLQ